MYFRGNRENFYDPRMFTLCTPLSIFYNIRNISVAVAIQTLLILNARAHKDEIPRWARSLLVLSSPITKALKRALSYRTLADLENIFLAVGGSLRCRSLHKGKQMGSLERVVSLLFCLICRPLNLCWQYESRTIWQFSSSLSIC